MAMCSKADRPGGQNRGIPDHAVKVARLAVRGPGEAATGCGSEEKQKEEVVVVVENEEKISGDDVNE